VLEPGLGSNLAAGLPCPFEPGGRELKLAVARNRLSALSRLGVVVGEARPEVLERLVDRHHREPERRNRDHGDAGAD